MGGGDIRVEVADDRSFVNTLGELLEDSDASSFIPSEAAFLKAGIELATKAIQELEHEALGSEGPSLYTGLLGGALLCLRCHEALENTRDGGVSMAESGDVDLLGRATTIVRKCEAGSARGKVYFTFFTGQSGVHALGAAVAAARKDRAEAERHMASLKALLQSPQAVLSPRDLLQLQQDPEAVDDLAISPGKLPHELLFGRVGLIWSVLFANNRLHKNKMPELSIPVCELDPVAATVLACGRALARDDISRGRPSISGTAAAGNYPPLMYEWHGKRYWGAAHGLVGIVHVLLQASKAGVRLSSGEGAVEEQRCIEELKGTLRYMIRHRFPSGNFPTSEERPEKDCRVHWCHGAPGFALTLSLFAKEFPEDQDFLDAAHQTADIVWQRGLLRRIGLCHGISGNAYSFLALGKVPGSRPSQLQRAQAFGTFLLRHHKSLVESGLLHPGDSRFSLMEGLGGPACLLLDLASPSTALFPGYEL